MTKDFPKKVIGEKGREISTRGRVEKPPGGRNIIVI